MQITSNSKSMDASQASIRMETWRIDRLIPYARNPRKNDRAVDQMCASILHWLGR
jgi:hypothetical protein